VIPIEGFGAKTGFRLKVDFLRSAMYTDYVYRCIQISLGALR